MNYGDVYPSQPCPPPLQLTRPPQVLISDHSSGLPMGPYGTSGLPMGPYGTSGLPMGPYHSTGHGVPYVPLIPGAIGSTTIPCTTPASVLPPSPPPVLTTQLPHVFISDHSEVPLPSESRTSPTVDVNINAPSSGGRSETKTVTIAVRRASEPAEVLTSSFAESRSEPEAKRKSRHALQRYHSSIPTSNQWLKRVVVLIICALVVGLAFKIGVELWKASYGEDNSAT